jgi:hypothetical protein
VLKLGMYTGRARDSSLGWTMRLKAVVGVFVEVLQVVLFLQRLDQVLKLIIFAMNLFPLFLEPELVLVAFVRRG